MYLGLVILIKLEDKKQLGLFLMIFGGSLAVNFELVLIYVLLVLAVLLYLNKKEVASIMLKQKLIAVFAGLAPLYTYVLAELKTGFLASKTIVNILLKKEQLPVTDGNPLMVFMDRLQSLFRNNIFDYFLDGKIILLGVFAILIYLVLRSRREKKYLFIFLWTVSFFALVFAGGFMPLYSYAGVGVGLIIATAVLTRKFIENNIMLGLAIITLVLISNVSKIYTQAPKSLVLEIKAQPEVRLVDEIEIVNKTYKYSQNNKFTLRITSMPYKVQTVWAYVYKQYGLAKYGYLPYLETGNVLGFPGEFPTPVKGSTCSRFLIIEPTRGIPQHLILNDQKEEDLFSDVVSEEVVGKFVVQHRQSNSGDCTT